MSDTPQPVRVMVVDDDAHARAAVRAYLAAEPGAVLACEVEDGLRAVEALAREDVDVLFLDVDMPGLDGFGVLETLGDARMPVVVFVTAHEEYAMRAFDVHALDYLVKPYGLERFRTAFRRARRAVEERAQPVHGERIHALLEQVRDEQRGLHRLLTGAPALERLMVKTGGRVLLLPVDDIDRAEADGDGTRLHVGGDTHHVRWKLASLLDRLDPRRFARVNATTLVNLARIRELRPWFAGDLLVILDDGTELTLDRACRAALEERTGSG